MELSPDQFASLKRVLTDPVAKVSAALNIPREQVQTVVGVLVRLTRRTSALGREQLVVCHDSSVLGDQPWTDSLIQEVLRNNSRVVTVGSDGRVISYAEGSASMVNASALSEPNKLTAHCSAGGLVLFVGGKPIAEIMATQPAIEKRLDWERSWTELPESFNDHFTHCVSNEKGFRYWHNREGRILLAGPDGTEKLFHHSLFWWCLNFVKDALDVHGEAQSMGQDKTDITIVTEVGSIVVEVKWLGRNQNDTRYAQIRIEEGVRQVGDYLQRNSRLIKGYLVAYDARDEQTHRNERAYPESCRHAHCEEPIILFLRSETPSELAHRTSRV